MVPRRDAKRDHNEKAIVLALRDAGYLVGEGPWFCDLAVYDANADKVFFLEVKSAHGKLTPTQQAASAAISRTRAGVATRAHFALC